MKRVVRSKDPGADVWLPKIPAGLTSFADPEVLAIDLMERLDAICDGGRRYEKIIFVGHSLGALLARAVYVFACGETQNAPFNLKLKCDHLNFGKRRDWAGSIERIILLAGMNRGWRVNHRLSMHRAAMWRVGGWMLSALSLFRGKPPLIFTIRKGAPFVTQLRIQWIEMKNAVADRGIGDALVIQLLGSIDDLVAPEDNVDLASGRNFIYLDVPCSGHANVVMLDDPQRQFQGDGSTVGDVRKKVFVAAFMDSRQALQDRAVIPSGLPDGAQDNDVDQVVFVIHGIRDIGYWTHKIARRVIYQSRAEGQKIKIATETSSYGFFPMLPFLLAGHRREKVEWLMDQYSESKALYPNAKFSYVGHSNGTYLLAKALEQYSFCRFERAVFVGSVVHRGYPWSARIDGGQIKRVLNIVATGDWVVAFFPRALQMLGLQDLGSAGHDGFDEHSERPVDLPEIRYVRGGHGAGIGEEYWPQIARFVLGADDVMLPSVSTSEHRNPIVAIPGYLAPAIWVAIGTLIVWIGSLLWAWPPEEWQKTMLVMTYAFGLWKIITSL